MAKRKKRKTLDKAKRLPKVNRMKAKITSTEIAKSIRKTGNRPSMVITPKVKRTTRTAWKREIE
jgi:ATP sulfurylase